ncbi:hypothetical protein B6D29_03640 [Microgenomates bacterium UTCPR1]|nr:hypothetical protein [Patescibacteria group bacterium]OQY65765.1 MAG: hypothetical protein B6D29_03640 [Microgenomates bacterium UTCPR1]
MKQPLNLIKNQIQNNLYDYLLLVTGGVFFLIAMNVFRGERLLEFITLLTFSGFYIIWGIYHHSTEDGLHLKTVIEYILIGFTILFFLKTILIP